MALQEPRRYYVANAFGNRELSKVRGDLQGCSGVSSLRYPYRSFRVGALKEVLVEPSFGVHYEDLSQAESADLIMQMLYHGWQESVNTRRDRAEEARRHFSYERMGQDLSKIFDAL